MSMKKICIFLFATAFVAVSMLSFTACVDDSISTDSSLRLSFSADTVSFDTVFSTTTTTTARFKVYNRSNENISISSVWIAGGTASPFRINVSGRTGASLQNIELRANDSLYVFVNATINPNNQNQPVLITDAIGFLTNGNTQYIQLEAVGQDVIRWENKVIAGDTTLTAEKPFLIYGNLVAKGNLTIAQGCKLYFHNKAGLEVQGKLTANGTLQEPILMRGDRIDYLFKGVPYDTLSGQWNGMKLLDDAVINHLEMRSGTTGIAINNKKLTLNNSTIHNFDSCAVFARNADVTITNSQLSNSGLNCLRMQGGSCLVAQTTIANFFSITKRKGNSVFLQNYDETNASAPIAQAKFENTIIIGSYKNEITLDSQPKTTTPTTDFNVNFFNCLIQGKEEQNPFYTNTVWVDKTKDIFVNTLTYPYNYQLKSGSPAIGVADDAVANQYPFDKNGVNRLFDGAPDIGAYEFVVQ